MTNEKLNKKLLNDAINAKKKFYWKREGVCDPRACGSACCRIIACRMHDNDNTYYEKVVTWIVKPTQLFNSKNSTYYIAPFNCPEITIDGRCKLHGKKTQPITCEKFPMVHTDVVYKYVKKYCGYKFVKTAIEDTSKIFDHEEIA